MLELPNAHSVLFSYLMTVASHFAFNMGSTEIEAEFVTILIKQVLFKI